MKYFDTIPQLVSAELIKRGVLPGDLLYCVKADLDGEGCYFDVYLTFTKETLHIISGLESYSIATRKIKRSQIIDFNFKDYTYIPLSDIKRLYVDNYQNSSRLMVEEKTEEEKAKGIIIEEKSCPPDSSEEKPKINTPIGREYSIAQFSIGFTGKFENFCQRANNTIEGKPVDDSTLNALKTHCPICGDAFPDPNRPICPYCIDRRSAFKRLLSMFSEFKGALFTIMLAIIISTAFTIAAPYLGSKVLYDDVLNPNGKFYGEVLRIVLLMAALGVAGTFMRAIYGIVISTIAPKVTHSLRCKIFSSMQVLSLPFFTSKQTGSLMSRIDNDTNNIYWFFTDIIPFGITNIVKIVGILGIIISLSPMLGIGIFIMLVLLELVQVLFERKQRRLYNKRNIVVRASNSILSDTMNGQRVVKAFAKENTEIDRYNQKTNDLFQIDSGLNQRIAKTMPTIMFVYRLVNIMLYCVGAWLVMRGNIAFGALTALVSYVNMLYDPIWFFGWIGDRWARCADAASRMFEILDSKPTIAESDNPVRVTNMEGNIQLKNVTFEYDPGHPVIKDVSFTIKGGQMFGIVGKTGAGKSTIINLMARLYDVTGGEILIDGVSIKDIATEDLRRNIGIVSQETYLFMGSIADNIRYARPDATMDEVIEAAKSANAHEFIVKLSDGYDTKIGAGAANLSGGERQRLSIARAIIQKPNILILDEATASMDTRTERKIQVALDNLKQGRTIISIAHRLSTLRDADMLCVIENGMVKENGTHDELIRKKGTYFELYKLQSDALKFIGVGE